MKSIPTSLFACACFLLLSLSPANAQLGISVGLDRGTRDLIDRLPENVRKQIEAAVRDLLPDIDKHVDQYLEKTDLIIRKNLIDGINALQCGTTGVIENAKETTAASLAEIFFLTSDSLSAPGIPHTYSKLEEKIQETRSGMKFSTDARKIELAYLDLMHFASIVNCQTKLDGLPGLYEIQAQTDRITRPALEWQLLVGNPDSPKCHKAAECAINRRKELEAFIGTNEHPGTADSHDVAAIGAIQLLEKLPKDPEAPGWVQQVTDQDHIDILAYEAVFDRERQLERLVEGARMLRQTRALDIWQKAKALADSQERGLRGEEIQMSAQTSIVDYQNGIPRSEDIFHILDDAMAQAKQAVALDPRLKVQNDDLEKEIVSMQDRAQAVHHTAVTTVNAHSIFSVVSVVNDAPIPHK